MQELSGTRQFRAVRLDFRETSTECPIRERTETANSFRVGSRVEPWSLDVHLRSDLDNAAGRNLEIFRRIAGRPGQGDEQPVLPTRHFGPGEAFNERRDRKKEVVMMSNFQPCLRQIASVAEYSGAPYNRTSESPA